MEEIHNLSQKLLTQYVEYMRVEKGLSEETIVVRVRRLKDFLKCVGRNCSLQQLEIQDIDEILKNKHVINGYSRITIQTYASAIRTFLTYVEEIGLCRIGLAKGIKLARIYKHETFPSAPSWDNVKQLIATTEGDHRSNIRDRTILMLLSIYGLRRSQVIKLCLNDLDWKNEILFVKHSKTRRPQIFPLSQIVGNAILNYLKQVRPPRCGFQEVFITFTKPYRPLKAFSVTQMVYKRFKLIDVVLKHYGTHSLRHACATHLINEGVSIKEISDYLGHLSSESTRIYAKVDLVNLRKVADFDIGDLL